MKKTVMSQKKVGEIAVAIVRYEATRKTITINPNNEQPEWVRIEQQIGIRADKLKEFLLLVILPAGLSEHFGRTVVLTPHPHCKLSDDEVSDISIKILRYKGIDLSSDFPKRLRRIEEFTKIPASELLEFYMDYIIPDVIKKIMGWEHCSISDTPTFG